MNIVEVKISEIEIGERRRKVFKGIEELADSIERIGLLHPIIITKGNLLVAGECRLRAFKHLDRDKIPARFLEDLSDRELRAIEIEENIKRRDLDWKEICLAVLAFDESCSAEDKDWSREKTAEALGITRRHVNNLIVVGQELRKPNNKVENADGLKQAINNISRSMQRVIDSEMERLDEVLSESYEEDYKEPEKTKKIKSAKRDILNANFLEWIESYEGPKFNFIHCDFPYGIKHDRRLKRTLKDVYEDSEDIYFNLLEVLLENRGRIMLTSCHMMFWFSMKHYRPTLQLFEEIAPELTVLAHPLIWHKSDNVGVLPDPERGPRQIYETALFISRGDRKIVKAKANSYQAPTARSERAHPSQKPEPVLRHFFDMFIDDVSEVFDPTCGSGTALAVAEAMGAKRILGLEIDKNYVSEARALLERQRRLEAARKGE